ncbi:MAG: chemotaxis protein CheA [Candidatus Omnitrophota bacterium]
MKYNEEYHKIYVQESDELLQEMNHNLLALEKDTHDSNALNAIFRSAHTLKSMSASMGYTAISELAHKMEDLLDQLRAGAVVISPETVDLLFKSFDSLEKMTLAVQEKKDIGEDISALVAGLDNAMIKGLKIEEEAVSGDITLNEFEKRTLARVKEQGFHSYHVRVTLDDGCVLKSVRAFMVFRNLHNVGEVIKSFPDSQSIEEEKFGSGFRCVFITREAPDTVREKALEILDVKKVEVEEMPVNDEWADVSKEAADSEQAARQEEKIMSGEHMRRIQTVRVDVTRLDKLMNLVEELAISKLRLTEIGVKLPDTDLKSVVETLNRLTDELQNEVMNARLVPVRQVFDRFPRLVRDLARQEGKKIKFSVIGGDIELDRTVLDEIGDPLIHILRNAVDHGIEGPAERRGKGKPEEGRITLTARREKSHVFIEVEDDGKGINSVKVREEAIRRGIITEDAARLMSEDDALALVTHPGFSTSKQVSDVSGRGVGLDVAKEKTANLGGGLVIKTVPGKGSKITMRLPITTAVIQVLLVKVSDRAFAIPVSGVVEIIVADRAAIKTIEGRETILHRDRVLPIIRLDRLFAMCQGVSRPAGPAPDMKLKVVIVESGTNRFGVVVDGLLSQQDVVIKQLTREVKGVRGFAGATILGDGSVALVLDLATLA